MYTYTCIHISIHIYTHTHTYIYLHIHKLSCKPLWEASYSRMCSLTIECVLLL